MNSNKTKVPFFFLLQSFSTGAEPKVAITQKICSHMSSPETQRGNPNGSTDSLFKALGGLQTVRIETKFLLEALKVLLVYLYPS